MPDICPLSLRERAGVRVKGTNTHPFEASGRGLW